MQKNAWIKWILIALAVVVSMALVTPFKTKVKYGLDLQGGSSFIVEVDQQELRAKMIAAGVEEAEVNRRIAAETTRARDVALEAIRNRVDSLGIAEPAIYPLTEQRIVVQMPGIDSGKREDARRSIESVAFLEFRLVHRQSERWIARLLEEGRAPRGFRLAGEGRHLVRDREAVKDEEMDRAFWAGVKAFSPREDAEFNLERDVDETGATLYRPYYLEKNALLTGDSVRSAQVDYDQYQRPQISLEFTGEGKKRFARITRDYAPRGEKNLHSDSGRQLAILMDGTLYSAPELRTEIAGGRAEITGRFSLTEAQRLVNVLRSGSLLAPMRIVEERTVDPTLGKDSIQSGLRAAIVGGGAVVLFMIAYYMLSGVIASLALMLTLFLLPLGAVLVSGFMGVVTRSSMGGTISLPTLTMPGIAGIVLTMGMAVDANVLIFERIREELKAGKSLLAAIDAGYDRAFTTILDSNLTTLLTAMILFWQASGPVRGFAIMLSAGILVSMFTAVFVTHLLFHALARRGRLTGLKMAQWVRDPQFDFIGNGRFALVLSAILIIVSCVTFALRGRDALGIDFLGGASVTIGFSEKVPEARVQEALSKAGIAGSTIQYESILSVGATGNETLIVKVPFESGRKAAEVLTADFAAQGFTILQQETIGPQIGRELQRKGLTAMLLALVGMVIYITWRFEFSYAVGAIVALFHDAVISVGLFVLLGRQLSMPMIAVVLTIVGYSVNDTIVVFDRIREQRKLHRDRPYRIVANASINQTLSRTVLTAGTTLLTALALLIFGGGAIYDFALLFLMGLIIGTYSSIFIATPITLLWHRDDRLKSS
jgi:SecD/SecF fusion protein